MTESKEMLWKLYDADQQLFFNDLNLAQLQDMINTIKKDALTHWHVSKDGGEAWFPLGDLLNEIENKTAKSPKTNLGALEVVGFDTFVKTVTGFQSTKAKAKATVRPIEKRKMKRISKKLKVLIDVGDQILEANTKDISVLGIQLDRKFHLKYRGKTCPVVLKSDPPIELRCVPLISEPDHMKGSWNRLKIKPDFNLNALVTLLEK